jgi:hypothetical protein
MKILDLSAAARGGWFEKSPDGVLFLDIRESVRPMVVGDSRNLPLATGAGFELVVFDPPHVNFGKNANMARDYGHLTTEGIRDLIRASAAEAHRVAAANALMAFKWNTHDQQLKSVLALMTEWWEPLFGQKTAMRLRRNRATYWVLLRRRQSLLDQLGL